MIEAAIIFGGVGLGILMLGRRRRVRRPIVVQDPPPVIVDPPSVIVDPVRNFTEGPNRQERIDALLRHYVSPTPSFGRLVQVRSGQTLESLVREAFDEIGRSTLEQRIHYIHCMSSGRYNSGVYGTPSVSKKFGSELLSPGTGIGLRVAFLPRNEDALHAMSVGRMPKMTVDSRTGEPKTSDRSLGMVWMPPVYEEGIRRGELPTCAPYSHEDGSSTIDPPPELLGLLEEEQ